MIFNKRYVVERKFKFLHRLHHFITSCTRSPKTFVCISIKSSTSHKDTDHIPSCVLVSFVCCCPVSNLDLDQIQVPENHHQNVALGRKLGRKCPWDLRETSSLTLPYSQPFTGNPVCIFIHMCVNPINTWKGWGRWVLWQRDRLLLKNFHVYHGHQRTHKICNQTF